MKFIVENEEELIEQVFKELKTKFEAGFKVGLIGDLGAGKTALTRGILKKLGVQEPVTSPTFTLRKLYLGTGGLNIQHIDLYRHEKNKKSYEIEEWISEDDFLTFVEWPDNLSNYSALFDVLIKITSRGARGRTVQILCR